MLPRYSVAAMLLASVASPVLAQSSVQDASAAADSQATDSNDILVTAQKIQQRAVDVPITISAASGERMRELGVSDLDELSSYIPGLNIQEQSANNPGIVIRGITSDAGSSQQNARVTMYYNGVDISRSRGAYQGIYDLERVEVVKGPQATLFGTASTVGAVSMTSARPKPGFSGALTGGYGNYDATLLSGFLNAGNDKIAGRVAFEWKKRDGYVNNLNPAQDDTLYGQDTLGIRTSLRFTPTDDLTIDLIGTYDRQRNGGTPFISRALPPGNPFGDANLGGSPVSETALGAAKLGLDRDVYDVNLTASWDFADGWNFTTVNGYRNFDSLEIFDADGSAAWFLEFAEAAKGWQASHESRFSYSDDQWRVQFGWNVFTEDNSQRVPFSTEEGTYAQCSSLLLGLRLPVAGLDCVAADGSVPAALVTGRATGGLATQLPYRSEFKNIGQSDSYSVFADTTWIPTRALELTAGVRMLIEQRKSGYTADVPKSVLTRAPLIPGQIGTAGLTYWAQESYAAVLPRFNALFRVSNAVNLYGTVSKGRRSPVVQLDAQRVGNFTSPRLQLVPEEVVWNYEGGIKGGTGLLSGSLGVYYQKYDNFQVSVLGTDGVTRTQSAGTASNLGVEAELSLRPTSWLNFFGNVAWIDGGIDRNSSFASTYSGAKFRLQPEWQAAGGFTINAPLSGGMRFFATPTVTYRSRIFFEVPNSLLISQGPVALVNARVGVSFADERFELAGFIRNALDKDYLLDAGNTGRAFGTPTFIPAEPRTFGGQLTARF